MAMTPEAAARARRRAWVASLLALALATVALLLVRSALDKVHVALVFLLIVLVGSAAGGRVLGFTLAIGAFVLFDGFFLPPYGTIIVSNPLDWLVLAAFLITSIVAAQLLSVAKERAEDARRYAGEVERLATLGAETLNAGRADDALLAIAEVIRQALTLDCCEIYWHRGAPTAGDVVGGAPGRLERVARAAPGDGRDTGGTSAGAGREDDTLAAWVEAHGLPAVERTDGTTHVAPIARAGETSVLGGAWPLGAQVRALLLPLRVRGRGVGVLRLAKASAITLRDEQRQFLDALAYYAALGVERLRLAGEAEHADVLREADRLKDALLAAVSHDLRTPLTTIKALAHAIVECGASVGDARAASIEEEADRLGRVVGDLLELSRLTGGALHLRTEVNAAEDLVGAVRRRVEGVRQGRELRVTHGPHDPMLLGAFDFVHSLRALGNLVENALRYTPPNAPVELAVQRDGTMLVFRVADRGPGIPEAERERIFEPFYRPPGAPPDSGGAGLGLTIAQGLAVAQGGAVRFSPRPGGGSVFELRLPAVDVPDTADAPDVTPA